MYNLLIFIGFIAYLPKILYKCFKQKGYKYPFLARLGFGIPNVPNGKRTFLFHANSLGETKAALTFAQYLKDQIGDCTIVFSSITETGKEIAEKSPLVNFSIYMPIDLSFIMRRFIKKIKPESVFIIETDFWLQFFKEVKRANSKLYLISGKISPRSTSRHKKFSFFSKKLFPYVDLFCLQNKTFKEAFCSIGVENEKIRITGNLKFDQKPLFFSSEKLENFRNKLKLSPTDKILTIASTHDPEEIDLIQRLQGKDFKILLAPRHPNRFDRVFTDLKKAGYSISRLSEPNTIDSQSEIILVDAMGLVPLLYHLSSYAIVGGSFIPKIGGHNVLEPILYGTPTLFGPYMDGQKDLTAYVLKTGFAKKTNLESLIRDVELFSEREEKPSLIFDQVCQKTWKEISTC